jgi:hypothetical protein
MKVARPWVGLLCRVPHGATHRRFDDLEKLWRGAKRNGTILTFFLLGGVPGFLCAMRLRDVVYMGVKAWRMKRAAVAEWETGFSLREKLKCEN